MSVRVLCDMHTVKLLASDCSLHALQVHTSSWSNVTTGHTRATWDVLAAGHPSQAKQHDTFHAFDSA